MTAPARALLSIGAVLSTLKVEFPDITISKIRFLEAEGLVEPERTAAGYRQFAPADVARLRFVLAAQRDQYLPLKVIKEQLDAIDRGLDVDDGAPRLPRALLSAIGPSPEELASGSAVRMSRAELLDSANLTEQQLAELEGYGLLAAGPGGWYDAEAALAAATVGELIAAGLEPRHLRQFRNWADRESALVAQLVLAQAKQRDPDARERAEQRAAELAAVLLRLHAILVKVGIRREL